MTDERLAALRDEQTLRECGVDVPERHGSPLPGDLSMTTSPFTFAAVSAAAGTPLAAAHPDRLADRDEHIFVLKEALRGLLLLRAQEQAGVRVPDRDDWERAWTVAADTYGEESPR